MPEPLAPLEPEVLNTKKAGVASRTSKSKQLHLMKILLQSLRLRKKTTPSSGKKRKAELSLDEEIAVYKADLNDTVEHASFENDRLPSCNVMRTKLNKLFDSGVMTKAEFCRATIAN
ncbi:hypothetical protein FGLOB1_14650 [Fusarium globosum]|uniref:Uncharacterized protein n=1 Tax=Fusarium globosum TaxID=78864 RepID=A0A8H5UHE3_9HYPO|nr:hypothetical protein FGLOB1_14650 [Fusarium globosum]